MVNLKRNPLTQNENTLKTHTHTFIYIRIYIKSTKDALIKHFSDHWICNAKSTLYIYIYILNLSWVENPANTYMQETEPLFRLYWVSSAVHTKISTIGEFSSHDKSNITLIPPFKYDIILFPAHEVNVMWIHNTDLGRRNPGGGRVLCREYIPSIHIRSSGRALSLWLVDSASLICDMNRCPSGKVSASAYCGCLFDLQCWRFLHLNIIYIYQRNSSTNDLSFYYFVYMCSTCVSKFMRF